MTTEMPVLYVKNVFFSYPGGEYVLRGLNLAVLRGEHVLVVGDTGSGKTTLARVVTKSGTLVYRGRLSGTVKILGRDLDDIGLDELAKLVHVIGQNPYSHFMEPLVHEDLLNYALRIYENPRPAETVVKKVIETTGIYKLVYRYFYELSGGEARRVLVARALISNPALLIFDEPLMWLDDTGVNDFLDLLRLLRRLGKSILIFEHRFLPLVRYVDRIYLLSGGMLREVTDVAYKLMKTQQHYSAVNTAISSCAGGLLLELKEVWYSYGNDDLLRGVNLRVREGDAVMVYGLNGSGKTTLLKLIAGYLKPRKGLVNRYGDIMYVPQNIILFYTEDTVEREIKEICTSRKRGGQCIEAGIREAKSLGIDPAHSPFNLSHGQMVKLAIVLARIAGAKVLLLDEPFSGLTYVDRVKLLGHLKQSGASFIVTTSTLDAYQKGFWTSAYKLEDGALLELSSELGNAHHQLHYAAYFYEALRNGVGH